MEEWLSLYRSKSGERGIFNRQASKKQVEKLEGRRDVEHDFGTNPCCLHPKTFVITDRGDVEIQEVVKSPEDYKVLSYNTNRGETEWCAIMEGKMTRPDAELIELEIESDSGELVTVKLTPDHLVYTENRGYVPADELDSEDSIIINI